MLVHSVPTPMAGSVYILPRDRVHPVDIPFTKAIGVFSKWGARYPTSPLAPSTTDNPDIPRP